ncbi:MAG: hypothetical protein RLZZ543_1343 [Bacteroidota bacterium]|jgi:hypothetical protein
MKISNGMLLLLLTSSLALSSCKKDEEEEPEPAPAPAAPSNPIPAPSAAFGALVAVQTSNYVTVPLIGEINQPVGVAVGVFGNLLTPAYVNAGTVQVNATALTQQSNKTYLYTPAATTPTGIDFNDSVIWSVSGDATTTAPAIDYTVPRNMPTGPKYSGSTTIGRTADFTLNSSVAIADADSIIYNVISNGKTITRTTAGTIQSVTFSAAEMGTLTAGGGYVQIVPFNISAQTFSGKQIYFVNESVATKQVTFN